MLVTTHRNFDWYWKRSLAFHMGLILFMMVANKFNLLNFATPEPKVISPSVRVDIVELPKYTLEELKKIEIAPPPQEKNNTSKNDEKISTPTDTKKSLQFLRKLLKNLKKRLRIRQLKI